ncbi:MAG: hypothetical protein OEZ68_06500 [Gammaproteobacteria bacterium]|nr:hypothetical protein [Gammaproteobacteria bacterium]MDH5800440.1 hypothetical protein [Gammaproteobacteria bacterium]
MFYLYRFGLTVVVCLFFIVACGGGSDSAQGESGGQPLVVTEVSEVEIQENNIEVLQVNVLNRENQNLSFSLDGSLLDSRLFSIDSTGSLVFNIAPDFENPRDENSDNIYETRIIVSNAKQSVSFDLSISVTDAVVNAAVNTAPFVLSPSSIVIEENQLQVATVIASDKEEHPISFSISGRDSSDFNLDVNSGALSFKVTPNYESPVDANTDNKYELRITASDGALSTTVSISVEVTDTNDAPIFLSSDVVRVYENTTKVQQIEVLDEDGDTSFTYAITGTDRYRFTVSDTGLLELASPRAYNRWDSLYEIVLTVDDGVSSREQMLSVYIVQHALQPNLNFGDINPENPSQRLAFTALSSNPTGAETVFDIAISGDQKPIVVGSIWNGVDYDARIWRYTAEGVLDTDLVTGFGPIDPDDSSKRLGYSTHRNAAGGDGNDRARGVVVTADNKIVVVGSSQLSKFDYRGIVWRYTQSGELDVEFGDPDASNPGQRKGYGVILLSSGFRDVGLALDGGIIATGHSSADLLGGTGSAMSLWKLTATGEPDTTFGLLSDNPPVRTGHTLWFSGDGEGVYGRYLALKTNGQIVVAGTTANDDPIVWAFNQDGTQASFEGRSLATMVTSLSGMAIAPDGGIMMLSKSKSNSEPFVDEPVLVRLTAGGYLDRDLYSGFGPTFEFFGFTYRRGHSYPIKGSTNADIIVTGISVLPNNKTLISGYERINSERVDSVVLRYNEDGFLEGLDYHNTGITTPEEDFPRAMLLTGDRVFVAGENSTAQQGGNKVFVKGFITAP